MKIEDRYVFEIVVKGFPELSKVMINTCYSKLEDAYFEYDKVKRGYKIKIDTSLRGRKRDVLVGGLAHEIAHIKRDVGFGPFLFLDELLYDLSTKYESWTERKTYLLVVQRGLGRELLEFVKWANRRGEEYTKEDGLTQKELELLLKNKVY